MTYSKTMGAVVADIDAFLSTEIDSQSAQAYERARLVASPPMKAVAVFNVLKGAESLTDEARRVLCGCAFVISAHQFSGLGLEATEVLIENAPLLPKEPEPEEPIIDEDIPI